MRKIEENMVTAVLTYRNVNLSNTSVEVNGGTVTVSLHGNPIFKKDINTGVAVFTLAGWDTNTTRSRLRALDVGVYRKDGLPHYKDNPIEDNVWYKV